MALARVSFRPEASKTSAATAGPSPRPSTVRSAAASGGAERTSTSRVTPVTFDRPTRGDDDVVAMRVRARRERLTRIVIGVVLASCAILVAAIVQIGTAGGEEEAAAARATATKLREAPLLGAIAPNAGSTLTSRTQTALRVEKRRETIRQGKVARARSAW